MRHLSTILLIVAHSALTGLARANDDASAEVQVAKGALVDGDGDPLPVGALYRVGTKRWRHAGEACSIALSGDEKLLAFIHDRREIEVMDAGTGRLLRTFRPHEEADVKLESLCRLAFSPDGKEIAVLSSNLQLLFCDLTTGKAHHRLAINGHRADDMYRTLLYSPDGKSIAVGHISGYRVIDRASDKIILEEDTKAPVCGLAFSRDGARLAVASMKPQLRIWDLKDRKITVSWEDSDLYIARCPAFSPDGNLVAVRGREKTLILDAQSGKVQKELTLEGQGVADIAFTHDGKQLIVSSTIGPTHVLNTADWSEKWRLSGDDMWVVRGVAVTKKGNRLVIGDALSAIKVWDIDTGKRLFEDLPAHGTAVVTTAFSPDGRTLVTGGFGNATHQWNALTGQHIRQLATSASFVSFTSRGDQLVTAAEGAGQIRIWNVSSGELLKEWNHVGAIPHFLALSRDQTRLAMTHVLPEGQPLRWEFRLVEFPSLRPLGSLQGAGIGTKCVALSADGSLAAVPSLEKVHVIRTSRHEIIAEFPTGNHRVETMAFSADGRFLYSAGEDKCVRRWEILTRGEASIWEGHTRSIRAIALHPNGRVVASADANHWDADPVETQPRIRFWDIATNEQVATLTGHNEDVRSLAFSTDGSRIVAGMVDTTAIVWEVPEPARSARVARATLSAEEASSLWNDLSAKDPKKGQRAVTRLAQDAESALALATSTLRPAAAPKGEAIEKLIAALDAEEFADRQQAFKKLASYGPIISSELERASKDVESREIRARCAELLKEVAQRGTNEKEIQGTRAVQLLEWIGDRRAQDLLKQLSSGAANDPLTTEAKAALARLAR